MVELEPALQTELDVLRKKMVQLVDISHRLSGTVVPRDILEAMTPLVTELSVDRAALLFVELDDDAPRRGEVIADMNYSNGAIKPLPSGHLPLSDFTQQRLLQPNSRVFYVSSRDDDAIGDAERQAMAMMGIATQVSLVVRDDSGRVVALLILGWSQARAFTPEELSFYEVLHALISPAVLNTRLRAAHQKSIQERANELILFRTLVESSRDPIVVVRLADLRIIYANQTAYDMFGYDYASGDLIGVDGRSVWPEEELQTLEREVMPHILQGSWRGEAPQLTKDGRRITVDATVFLIEDENGERTRMGLILRDITEAKRAQQEREQLQQQVIEAQRQALADLSTPIIPVMDGIIVMPLIGSIDTARARDITRALLSGISRYRARIAILDITGVPLVDSGVADHLNRTIQAARLKGTYAIVTGISDAVAETIVDLGIDWSRVETLADLQSGLMKALSLLGMRLISAAHSANTNGSQ